MINYYSIFIVDVVVVVNIIAVFHDEYPRLRQGQGYRRHVDLKERREEGGCERARRMRGGGGGVGREGWGGKGGRGGQEEGGDARAREREKF